VGLDSRGGAGADGAAVGLDGPLDDGEAEAGSLDLALIVMFLDAEKALEDEGDVGGRDARAVVGDLKSELSLPGRSGADLDLNRNRGVLLEGVLDQVEEDLDPIEAIPFQGETGIGDVDRDGCLLLLDECFEPFEDVGDALLDVEGGNFQRGAGTAFESGDDEHFLDDAVDADDVLPHDAEHVLRGVGVGEEIVLEEVFEVAADDGEGSAEFVGGIGHEVLPDLVGADVLADIAESDEKLAGGLRRSHGGDLDNPVGFVGIFRELSGERAER
jgi:hypothetical protein